MTKGSRPNATGPEQMLTVADVAREVKVSARQVRRWIDSGELVTHRFDRLIRISRADLDDFLARKRDARTHHSQ
jgi:excisionase family DNA binding protein